MVKGAEALLNSHLQIRALYIESTNGRNVKFEMVFSHFEQLSVTKIVNHII